MYLDHFGLNEHPFNLTPDPDFYFGNLSHQNVMNMLLVALNDGAGFIKVTGEVGTGKTLLCRKLVNELGDGFKIVFLPNPPQNKDELYRAISSELSIPKIENISSQELLQSINNRLLKIAEDGTKVVIVIDEAQAIPDETMEVLRLLTNLETEKFKLFQIVLFGQPELDKRLKQKSLRQLQQRIVFSGKLNRFDYLSFRGYIQHRLIVAGYNGQPMFSRHALWLLYKASKGIPRLVNIIAHKALIVAFGKGRKKLPGFIFVMPLQIPKEVKAGSHTQ